MSESWLSQLKALVATTMSADAAAIVTRKGPEDHLVLAPPLAPGLPPTVHFDPDRQALRAAGFDSATIGRVAALVPMIANTRYDVSSSKAPSPTASVVSTAVANIAGPPGTTTCRRSTAVTQTVSGARPPAVTRATGDDLDFITFKIKIANAMFTLCGKELNKFQQCRDKEGADHEAKCRSLESAFDSCIDKHFNAKAP